MILYYTLVNRGRIEERGTFSVENNTDAAPKVDVSSLLTVSKSTYMPKGQTFDYRKIYLDIFDILKNSYFHTDEEISSDQPTYLNRVHPRGQEMADKFNFDALFESCSFDKWDDYDRNIFLKRNKGLREIAQFKPGNKISHIDKNIKITPAFYEWMRRANSPFLSKEFKVTNIDHVILDLEVRLKRVIENFDSYFFGPSKDRSVSVIDQKVMGII